MMVSTSLCHCPQPLGLWNPFQYLKMGAHLTTAILNVTTLTLPIHLPHQRFCDNFSDRLRPSTKITVIFMQVDSVLTAVPPLTHVGHESQKRHYTSAVLDFVKMEVSEDVAIQKYVNCKSVSASNPQQPN